MTSNLDKHKADLDNLLKLGDSIAADLSFRHQVKQGSLKKENEPIARKIEGTFESEYQRWYTEAAAVIKQLLPDRLAEFEHLYKSDGKRKEINATTYHVQDWLNGIRSGVNNYTRQQYYDDFAIVSMRFNTQRSILSVAKRFESSLFDIRQIVQADLFDSELDAARELTRHRFPRGAGAIAGVVLEKHLAQVALNHNISVRKKDPTISGLNDALKNGGVFDVPTWRQIQRLGDIRNLCDHNKEREPTVEEVQELIDGVDKITKTLF